jgi:hypothetical protein
MNFNNIQNQYHWVKFAGQNTTNVTYVFVLNQPVQRLYGASDILYIGETRQPISRRYAQETRTSNTPGNTQQTNIRLTHIFGLLNLVNVTCYFTDTMHCTVAHKDPFLKQLSTWDKKYYLGVANANPAQVSLEKKLIVSYAVDHREAPPLNNRM